MIFNISIAFIAPPYQYSKDNLIKHFFFQQKYIFFLIRIGWEEKLHSWQNFFVGLSFMANVVFHGRWRREPAFKLHFTTLHALKGGRKVAICKILPPPLPLPLSPFDTGGWLRLNSTTSFGINISELSLFWRYHILSEIS